MVVSIEDNQPSSSNNVGGSDDCFLVVELSEDDPLFEKKLKLLKDKGFGPSDSVYLQKTLVPHSLRVKLDALLERARIIHLNETELYFGASALDEGITEEFYSPRNELEALNCVLSLVDHYSGKSDVTNASLKALRVAIISRICNFGNKNKLETEIVKEACNSEKHLMSWAESHGLISKLQIAYVEGAGRGVLATEDLGVGDIALEIPISVIISEDLVYESDMIHILEKIDGISAETMLLLWSMRERHNIDSKYKFYFDALPEQFNTGLSFGVEATITLDGTLALEEILQAKQHLRSEYDKLFPALSVSFPGLFSPEFYTWEQYLWACELWYSNSMKIMFPDGKLKTCLIPVAGFLNHSVCPHILHYGKVDSVTNTLKFPLSRPCNRGEQCYLSYGNLSSSHLLTFYGFVPQELNLCDIIPLDIEAGPDCSSEEGCQDSTTHMVRGTWLSVLTSQGLFYYGLPSPLLEHLRNAVNPGLHTMTLLQESLETEMMVLDDLYAIFDGMMKRLDDSVLEDRLSEKWDVQLAIQYKDLQRNIVSSILTACQAGRKMVTHELKRCMDEDIDG
ncbi:LOW QUALITY PROTEIN: N-lysine methyltransferase SETD6-like [Chenopodium quinoa]|uniref:LOW QUALITY PROTEIN: N-lysine methyltransferase SETD6-like n=1 Tax=Chenopodium quinoa TaxID=63459 RepID=UPI000B776368|nr:LOW QUALITY PROTEIN: N-lysine methyltransferase SETD6-like [Chenopodium quinoa]